MESTDPTDLHPRHALQLRLQSCHILRWSSSLLVLDHSKELMNKSVFVPYPLIPLFLPEQPHG